MLRRRLPPGPWLGLTAVWVLLWGEVSVGNVLAGVLLGATVLLAFPFPPVTFGVRVHPWALLVLLWRFGVDLVFASVEVAYKAVAPWVHPHGRLLAVTLRSDAPLFCTLTAEMTSLVSTLR